MASKKKSKRTKDAEIAVPEDLFTEKRKPGRPKKMTVEASKTPPKRKPGRPRKEPVADSEVTVTATPKRKPGRPKKAAATNGNGHGYSIQVKLHGGATLGDIVRVAETLKSNPAVQSVEGTFF